MARIAKPWLVQVLNSGHLQRFGELPFPEPGLSADRVLTNVNENLNAAVSEPSNELVDRPTLVADCEQCTCRRPVLPRGAHFLSLPRLRKYVDREAERHRQSSLLDGLAGVDDG